MNIRAMLCLLAVTLYGCAETEMRIDRTVPLERPMMLILCNSSQGTNNLDLSDVEMLECSMGPFAYYVCEPLPKGTEITLERYRESHVYTSIIPGRRGRVHVVYGSVYSSILSGSVPFYYYWGDQPVLNRAPWEGVDVPTNRPDTPENIENATRGWGMSINK
jgi:hypothetical protein